MIRTKYDIFISYRREFSEVFATLLKYALEKEGYVVFLDSTELTDGKFDHRIMNAIDSSSVFVFILAPHALDKCVSDSEDWVRKEIEYAVLKQKHIVPINPDKTFSEFPLGVPDMVRSGIGLHQFSEIMMGQLFESSFQKMIRERILPIIEPGVEIIINSSVACRLFLFDEEEMTIKTSRRNKLKLLPGKYHMRFEKQEFPYDVYEKNLSISHEEPQAIEIEISEQDFRPQTRTAVPRYNEVLAVLAQHCQKASINAYSEFDNYYDYEKISYALRRFNIYLNVCQIKSYVTVGTFLANFTRFNT